MLTVRQILIAGWIILLMFVVLSRATGTPPQAQGQVSNQAQVVEVYERK